MARKRPKDVIDGLRVVRTEARSALDKVMLGGEFREALISELKKEAPDFLSPFIVDRAFSLDRLSDGWSFVLRNHRDEGQLLAYWNFGTPEYDFPAKVGGVRVKSVHMNIPGIGVKAGFHHKAVPPMDFIQKAWHRTLNRYTMRIKREIEKAIRGR